MDTSDTGKLPVTPGELALTFADLRQPVMDQWSARVVACAALGERLGSPVLAPLAAALFDAMRAALAAGRARAPGDLVARFDLDQHDRGRLVHELQLFRCALFSVLGDACPALSTRDSDLIGSTFEAWMRSLAGGRRASPGGINDASIAGFAHDLRNPLNVASASAQLIGLKSGDPAIANLAARIVKRIAEADALIQMLQDASLLRSGQPLPLQISTFDIMTLVEEVCADLPLLGQPVNVVGERIEGWWCRKALKRALENLVARARKHGRSTAPITVRVSLAHGQVRLAVHNGGPAIPEEQMARLFEPPDRLDEVAVKGWSLGLPYVRSVAESHGGAMTVDSADERGTTFTVRVPVDARAHAPA